MTLILVAGCNDPRAAESLNRAVETALKAGVGAQLDISSAMPTEWDTLVVVNPYSSADEIDKAVGFRWRARQRTEVMHNDHSNLLIFIRKGRVVESIVMNRAIGDFCCFERNGRYARHEAVFVVTQDALSLRLQPLRAVAPAASK